MAQINNSSIDELFEGILQLQTVEECYSFFHDLATVPELKSMAQRFQVAKLLYENETYTDISTRTGASTATISRVNRSLNYGNDGYDMVFERLNKEDSLNNKEK